ncbi:F0F1 ATP synthase subunit delta [Crenobacter sp. SG2303]|uniref:ATP synthase subunit delta n=1 Tax=Crenobacter oryzisoli TaxID=3056844 RepID=A0ABT7XLK1_9NEIS|nr:MULTISPECIES: F0F1 ATP synthase subunit delta [unclassified Crenobacter]MDN0074630.1 F0F1 ATP synthase subunit delta [Crenobacter sp. SG2303]MDN0084349.1 F0F1 ATP synthase subunit delta [Crenobacter sp. SG2305]
MAELTTVARPYAEAVFSLANEQQRLGAWSEALAWLAAMVQNPVVTKFVTEPKHTAQEIEALVLNVLGAEQVNAEVKNLVVTLIANGRLLLLPEIAEQFELLKAEAEGVLDALAETAFPMTDEQKTELIDTLSKKYGKTVRLDVRVTPELIGGVRVLVGDDVIDASIRGKLQDMAASLKN